MDFKKFGTFVLILGIGFLLYGGIQWFSYQPIEVNPAKEGVDRIFALGIAGVANSFRAEKRDEATKILIVGGIVAFLGLSISYSSKKKE